MTADGGGEPPVANVCLTSCGAPLGTDDVCPAIQRARADDVRRAYVYRLAVRIVPVAAVTAVWSAVSLPQAVTVALGMGISSWALLRVAEHAWPEPGDVYEGYVFALCGLATLVLARLAGPTPWPTVVMSLLTTCLAAASPTWIYRLEARQDAAADIVRSACRRPCAGCKRWENPKPA